MKDKSSVDNSSEADASSKFKKLKSTKQDSLVSDSIPRSVPKSKSAIIDVKSTKKDHSLSKSLPIGVPKSTSSHSNVKSTNKDNTVSKSNLSGASKSRSAHSEVKSTKKDPSLSKSLPNGKSRKRERSPHDNTPHNDIKTKVTKGTKGTSGNNDSEEVIGMSRDEVKREVEEFVIKKVGEGMKEKKVEYTHARKKGRDRIYKPLKREGKPIIIEEWEIEWEILKDYRAKNGVKSGRISIDVLERMKKQ